MSIELIAEADPGVTSFRSVPMGGSGEDGLWSVVIDGQGNSYAVGDTTSPLLCVPVRDVGPLGDDDVLATKWSPEGHLLWTTRAGGAGDDLGAGLITDDEGQVYAVGGTDSADFPVTTTAIGVCGRAFDGFIVKLDAAGELSSSTCIGGSGGDGVAAVARTSGSQIVIAGWTSSPDFPVVDALQAEPGGESDGFVTALDLDTGYIAFSTYLGGSGNDAAYAVKVAADDTAYVVGYTTSTDFPTVNAVQSTFGGGSSDIFVTRIDLAERRVVYSTFLGGSQEDSASGGCLAVDAGGYAYACGHTSSPDFPVYRAVQRRYSGGNDGFLAKLTPAGGRLVYSTYLGGKGFDSVTAIALDERGEAWLAGATLSFDFPLARAIQPFYGGGFSDAFVAKLSTAGTTLRFSSYLGGGHMDQANDVAAVANEAVFVGSTRSVDFPFTSREEDCMRRLTDGFAATVEFESEICPGDCDGDGVVTINEIINAVAGALGSGLVDECPDADGNRDGAITVDEIVAGVDTALNGCRALAN